MARSREELAQACREALQPALPAPPLLTTEAVAHAAELQALRVRTEAEPVRWNEPPEAPRATDAVDVPPEVERLLGELAALARRGEAAPLARVVPAGDAGESFLRASLLSLAGARWAGEGIAGRLGALPLTVEPEGDGWPEPLTADRPEDRPPPLARLTPGAVHPQP
jgi:hypothetical protein